MDPTDATGICSRAQAKMAEIKVVAAGSWNDVYHLYRDYVNCDDGAIAEGFSEVVTLQLAENWREVDQLSHLIRKTPEFQSFVVSHIGASVPVDRLLRIQFNASELCPSDLPSLCGAIRAAASDAAK